MASQSRNLRVRAIRDYDARLRDLTEAFNLPSDVREWATVRYDPDAEDDTLKYQVVLHATAGRTVATLEVPGAADLQRILVGLLKEYQESLHARLKADLATNLMAGMTAGPVERGDDDE
jgi:hypothetical protein